MGRESGINKVVNGIIPADEIDISKLKAASLGVITDDGSSITRTSLSDGEFLKNEGGTLQGATVSADAGEGVVFVPLFEPASVGQGTWDSSTSSNFLYNFSIDNSGSSSDGDNVSFDIYLAAGTYKLIAAHREASNRGITDIDIDSTEVASHDQYASGTTEVVTDTTTGIVISTTGPKTLKIRVDGKNGSSSNHNAGYQAIALVRTA